MLSPSRDVLGLERINAVLERLDNPQHRLPYKSGFTGCLP